MGGAWLSIQKQLATDVGCFTRPRQPHDGICTFFRGPQYSLGDASKTRQRRLHPRGICPARVHAVDHNTLCLPLLSPEFSQDRQRPFRSGVGDSAVILTFRHDEVITIKSLGIHSARDDIDDPRWAVMMFK